MQRWHVLALVFICFIIFVIGVMLFAPDLDLWQADNARVSEHIQIYEAYYEGCIAVSDDVEMCRHLAASFVFR